MAQWLKYSEKNVTRCPPSLPMRVGYGLRFLATSPKWGVAGMKVTQGQEFHTFATLASLMEVSGRPNCAEQLAQATDFAHKFVKLENCI